MSKPFTNLKTNHDFPGLLIICEGIDGSGKSTQLHLLKTWLQQQEYDVFFTEWNSSQLVKKTTKIGKKKKLLTPTTFSLIHATDFADRLEHAIIPPLKAGMIVLADRYVFTAFSRDTVRGVNREWVRNLYNFAVRPDLAFYFRPTLETALERILLGRSELKYYEAGMDLGLSHDPLESFRLFQERIMKEYDLLVEEWGLQVIDSNKTIEEMQSEVRESVKPFLKTRPIRRSE
ncbi:MAG: dTMP kinase [Candidatus Omnitrophica bacterium]|nr:Thymidylate kinase [bacterium]NUN96498.1 dTMP kinase [Candidatus Omnitrophota bacterium]